MDTKSLLDKIEVELIKLAARIEAMKQGPPNDPPFVVCQPNTIKAFFNTY